MIVYIYNKATNELTAKIKEVYMIQADYFHFKIGTRQGILEFETAFYKG